jgi:ABC-type Mn2+/Zn2+ transport system permease subunit
VGVQAVGVILVVALLITPGAIGVLMADRFGRMCAVSVARAGSRSRSGCIVSFLATPRRGVHRRSSSSTLFALALAFSPRHGLARRRPA